MVTIAREIFEHFSEFWNCHVQAGANNHAYPGGVEGFYELVGTVVGIGGTRAVQVKRGRAFMAALNAGRVRARGSVEDPEILRSYAGGWFLLPEELPGALISPCSGYAAT